MSEDLKNLKRKVRSIERKYKTNNKPEVKQEYKTKKSEYKKLLQKTKKEYINDKFMKCGSNTKKLYKTLNQIIGKNKEVTLPPGKDMDCANNLLNHFMDKIKKINENLENYELFTPPSNSSNHKLEDVSEISADEVKKIIMESKPTTCGSDPIPSTVVKHQLNILLPILTRLINWSLRTGSFHKTWKKSIIIPLQKKVGQDTGYTNYRPVNNLPFLSKITEKVMIQQLNLYLETHCPLPDTVCAYRKNLSTKHAILKLLDTMYKNMDKQCVTLVTAIDLSATFDMVNHGLLLKVLNQTYNIKGTALKWFTSYLSDCSVCVQINNRVSQELDLPFSVPQGSCAGPILFNIYISTLNSYLSSSNCDILGYADNNTISACIDPNIQNNEQWVVGKIQNSLEKTKHWMCLNRLKMNDQMTNFITYGNNVQLAKCSTKHIKIGDEIIVGSDKINLLGIDIDKNLTFKEHIKKKCNKTTYNLYSIRSLRQHLNNKTTQTLIYGLVTSHLDYKNAIYSTLPASITKPLNRIQNLAAKLVLNNRTKRSAHPRLNRHFIGCPLERGQYTRVLAFYTLAYMEGDQELSVT